MSDMTPEQMRRLEEELKERKALIGSFPENIKRRINQLGIEPGEIEIQIQQRNGLFVNINRKK